VLFHHKALGFGEGDRLAAGRFAEQAFRDPANKTFVLEITKAFRMMKGVGTDTIPGRVHSWEVSLADGQAARSIKAHVLAAVFLLQTNTGLYSQEALDHEIPVRRQVVRLLLKG
jgi:hypothetical protein